MGSVVINGKYTQEIDLSTGSATITDLKNLLSGGFRFDAEQYNNIRFTDGVTVDEIEVVPVERSITEIQINSTRRSGDSIKLVTNLDPQETPYRVVYGTESVFIPIRYADSAPTQLLSLVWIQTKPITSK